MALFSVQARGPLEHLMRVLAVLAVVCLTMLAFWKRSEVKVQEINSRFGLADETKSLSADERARVQDFIATLRKRYGIEARVLIARAEPALPEQDGKTLCLAVSTERRTASVLLPPLVARALGPEFARQLEREHFPFHFGPGQDWRKGLVLALDLIENSLAGLDSPEANATAAAKDKT